jgi:hypothetical protein
MTFNENDHPRGDAGRFTETHHAEAAGVTLLPARPGDDVLLDADNTEWDWTEENGTVLEAGDVNGLGIRVDTSATDSGAFGFDVVDYSHGDKTLTTGGAGSVAQAKEDAKDARYALARYREGYRSPRPGDATPWGPADIVEDIAPGIDRAVTPGHGGYKLSEERNREVAAEWRDSSAWYEEDSEWAIVAITHREAFSDEDVAMAHKSSRAFRPEKYMRVVGKNPAKYGITDYQTIGPGESPVLDVKHFFAANAKDVERVWSGVLSDEHPDMVEASVSPVKKDGTRGAHKARRVLIPKDEYDGLDTLFHTIPKNAGYTTIPQETR